MISHSDNNQEVINIQGGILKGHGRAYCGYLILRINSGITGEQLKRWVNTFTIEYLTTHNKQQVNTENFKRTRIQTPVITIGFTYSGLEMLLSGNGLEEFQREVFRHGMNHPKTSEYLFDYNVEYDPEFTTDFTRPKIGLVVMVAASTVAMVEDYLNKIRAIDGSSDIFESVTPIYGFKGVSPSMGDTAVGPLGFADGLSESRSTAQLLEDVCLIDHPPNSPPAYGTFMAIRKLKIDRTIFKQTVRKLPGLNARAEASIMGRFRNGTPLALHGKPRPMADWRTPDLSADVHFDYNDDADGSKCPLGAHVRKMNPRKNDGFRAILRRGMLFARDPRALTDRNFEDSDGLLFLSYQKSLEDQFLPLFEQSKRQNADLLVYRDDVDGELSSEVPITYGQKPTKITLSPALSKFVGGEFFYLPSPQFLENLSPASAET